MVFCAVQSGLTIQKAEDFLVKYENNRRQENAKKRGKELKGNWTLGPQYEKLKRELQFTQLQLPIVKKKQDLFVDIGKLFQEAIDNR